MNTPQSSRWYVVQTHQHAEAKALSHLLRQGFQAYLPRYLKRRRHARRTDIVAAPLFPGYLFVAIDLAAQRWRAIQSTSGVTHLVCVGQEPAAVANAIVEELKALEDAAGFVRLPPRTRFRPGDKIRVMDGVFSSCMGLFEGMRDRQRVAILLDLLGRKVRVVVDKDCVAAA